MKTPIQGLNDISALSFVGAENSRLLPEIDPSLWTEITGIRGHVGGDTCMYITCSDAGNGYPDMGL